ncbi:hypothetical protein ES703_21438 [subsurface metagenome]
MGGKSKSRVRRAECVRTKERRRQKKQERISECKHERIYGFSLGIRPSNLKSLIADIEQGFPLRTPPSWKEFKKMRAEAALPETVLFPTHQCMKCGALLVCECEKQWYQKYLPNFAEFFKEGVAFHLDICFACTNPKKYREYLKMLFMEHPPYGDWVRTVMRAIELMHERDRVAYDYFFGLPRKYAEDTEKIRKSGKSGASEISSISGVVYFLGEHKVLIEKFREKRLNEAHGVFQEFKRAAKNEIRKKLGLPEVGEGWVRESQLYNTIKKIFSDYRVIRHATPSWLGGQHLDAYVPKLELAIEHMGRQHFEPIDFFGGEKAFKKIKEYDKRKGELCKKNDVSLIYFTYKDDLSEENVRRTLNEKMPQPILERNFDKNRYS